MVFILGIERSATTWVSNLIDAHPMVRVYVEPLSHFTSRFKQWPDRFKKLRPLKDKADYFNEEFEIIKKRKRWLFTRFSNSVAAWSADLKLSDFLIRKNLADNRINDFYEINFHRKNRLQEQSRELHQMEAIKELRLNFNTEIIPFIDKNARVIVVVREMAANVQSILKHITQGGLAELKSLLLNHYGELNEQAVFKYWRDSYNQLLKQMDNNQMPYLVLNHNELITDPKRNIQALCDFLDLRDPESIKNYLHSSNQEGVGLHNTKRSHKDLLRRNRKARNAVYPKIEVLLEQSDLHPILKQVVE